MLKIDSHTAQKLAATLLQRCNIAIAVHCCRDIAKTLFWNIIPAMLQQYLKTLLELRINISDRWVYYDVLTVLQFNVCAKNPHCISRGYLVALRLARLGPNRGTVYRANQIKEAPGNCSRDKRLTWLSRRFP